jgi:glycine dehydrogenase
VTREQTLNQLLNTAEFIHRHVGPNEQEIATMLKHLDLDSLEDLLEQTVPKKIRLPQAVNIPESRSEQQALDDLQAYASENQVNRSYIGMGYFPTKTPTVILRNVLQNPAWYTAYTPYQPEIAKGRLEAI